MKTYCVNQLTFTSVAQTLVQLRKGKQTRDERLEPITDRIAPIGPDYWSDAVGVPDYWSGIAGVGRLPKLTNEWSVETKSLLSEHFPNYFTYLLTVFTRINAALK